MSDDGDRRRPLLRVLTPGASDEEIAAVLAVVLARSGRRGPAEPEQTSTWADPGARHRLTRTIFTPGRDSWRTSSWPR